MDRRLHTVVGSNPRSAIFQSTCISKEMHDEAQESPQQGLVEQVPVILQRHVNSGLAPDGLAPDGLAQRARIGNAHTTNEFWSGARRSGAARAHWHRAHNELSERSRSTEPRLAFAGLRVPVMPATT